jgi:peptidoglycan LD-endopeptidase LytH
VDILAPGGTPVYAYENGVINRMSSNSLGGITLYLEGNSGNLYYYAHLSGYVSSIGTGQRVSAGQHIALVGMTGNAPVNHLHWEVMPGGGGNVNPYPYAQRACG